MGAAGDLFLQAARRLGSPARHHQKHSGVEELLEALEYLDHDAAPGTRPELIRNRAAILRAGALVADIFSAESPDAPGARFVCGTADPGLLGDGYTAFPPTSVAGCDREPGRAFERCVGEAVEYLSQLDGPDDARAAGGDLPLASGFDALSDEPRVRAVALDTGGEFALPARLCLRRPGPLPAGIGTGCAAGRTWTEAVVSGLWELIERDAVAAWWHEGAPPHPLAESVVAETQGYLAPLRGGASGRRTQFLDISSRAGLPVVVACSFSPQGDRFAAGFAAHPDVGEAARKAAREMLQMELGLRFVAAKQAAGRPALNADDEAQVRRAVWVTPAHPALRGTGAPREAVQLSGSSADDMLRATVARLHAMRVRPYAVDLTRSRFRIPVAKVVAPGLRRIPDEAAWAAVDPASRIPLL